MEEVNKKIDWEQRRYEIAKDFLTATCRRVYLDESSAEYYSKKSIYFADKLIEELKKK